MAKSKADAELVVLAKRLRIPKGDAVALVMDPPEGGKKSARWRRTLFLKGDGEILLPAAFLGNGSELAVWMMAGFDGIGTISKGGHVYVPCSWAVREFKGSEEMCRAARDAVLRSADTLAESLAE